LILNKKQGVAPGDPALAVCKIFAGFILDKSFFAKYYVCVLFNAEAKF